jgi:hypothetical protein
MVFCFRKFRVGIRLRIGGPVTDWDPVTDRGPVTDWDPFSDWDPITDRDPVTDWDPVTDRDPVTAQYPELDQARKKRFASESCSTSAKVFRKHKTRLIKGGDVSRPSGDRRRLTRAGRQGRLRRHQLRPRQQHRGLCPQVATP